jgi:uncharacterized protein YdeI (YjbR/CyaY-like superfamily)
MSAEKNPWINNEKWDEEIDLLRAIILKTELVETTKWGGEVYTINNKNVLGIGGFKNHFVIWFFNGVFLKDEAKVLFNANEGVTKGLRQWRFTSANEINEKIVLQYILEAIENEKAGFSIKPEKKEAMKCEILETELANNIALNEAFLKFSPYKQKEFWEYMATAKQEKTKLTRLEKIKPIIMQNRGLNDKYRA